MSIVKAMEKVPGYFTCFTSGLSFRHKEELKSLGFYWDAAGPCWVKEGVSEAEKLVLEKMKVDKWFGMFLEFKVEDRWRTK